LKAQTARHSRLSLARRLRLQQLMVFEKVVEAGSILAASEALAMTQPAVSKSIHELEQQLDGTLFVRGKRGVTLTEFGNLFERHARALLAELRYLADDLNASQSGIVGEVIVGTLISAAATLLPEAIVRLRRAAPDVRISIRVGSNPMLFPALARGELDVVVGVLPRAGLAGLRESEQARLAHVSLFAEALNVVVGSQHALARGRTPPLSELHELEWIVPSQDSVAYPSVREFFAGAGLALPRRLIESVSIMTNLALLAKSEMVALMPQSAAERFARSGSLVILPFEGLAPFSDVGYTVRSDRRPTAATERFLAALREAGDETSRTR